MDPAKMAQLKELASMKDAGILSEAEFAQQKAALLAGGTAQPAVGMAVAPTPPPQMVPNINASSNNANNIVVQNVTQGGGNNRPHKYDASMLGGAWTAPTGDCCNPYQEFMLTPMGDDAFDLNGEMYLRQGSTDNFGCNMPGGVRMAIFLNQNQARLTGAGLPDTTLDKEGAEFGGGGNIASNQVAPMPQANIGMPQQPTAPQPQVMQQPSGPKFDPMTGQPIPKFNTETGQQNW